MIAECILSLESAAPIALNRKWVLGKGRMFRAAAWTRADAIFRVECMAKRRDPQPYPGPVKVEIWQRPRLDIDALAKFVLDSMQGVIYVDDKQVEHLSIHREAGRELTSVQVWRIEP